MRLCAMIVGMDLDTHAHNELGAESDPYTTYRWCLAEADAQVFVQVGLDGPEDFWNCFNHAKLRGSQVGSTSGVQKRTAK